MVYRITKCREEDSARLAELIRGAFRDVAERFGLTPENAPRHPSNCTAEWFEQEMERGTVYFILESENRAAGCVAIEQANPEACYLERLGILPAWRRRGFGQALVSHVVAQSRQLGAKRVEIGIIAEHHELKGWYERLGFTATETKRFPHLPFTVCYMSREI